jgi:hypothetical protein
MIGNDHVRFGRGSSGKGPATLAPRPMTYLAHATHAEEDLRGGQGPGDALGRRRGAWPSGAPKGHQELPTGGHEIRPEVDGLWSGGLSWGAADGADGVAQPAGAPATAGQGGYRARPGHASQARPDASLSI